MQGAAVLGLDRAEFGRAMPAEEGRIGMLAAQSVFLDPGQPLARGVGDIALRRLVGFRPAHQQRLRLGVHARRIDESGIGQPLDRGGILEIESIDLLRQNIVHRALEIDPACHLIDPDQLGDHPVALRELRPLAIGIAIEMAEAVALGPPDQRAVVEPFVIVGEIDPVVLDRCVFGEQHLAGAGRRIDPQHVEHGLLAVLALDVERAAIGRPVDARDVDVGLLAQIDLDAVAAVGVHHEQFDQRIGAARHRIALVVDLGPGGTDRRTGDHADRALVEALDRDTPVLRAPPIAGEPPHLFLRDEFGLAPADVLVRFLRGHGCRLAADRADPQAPIAHEGDVFTRLAQRGVELAFLGVGQPERAAIEPREIEVAVERDQHTRAVACPLIVDDALEAADVGALALHLLVLGQFAPGPQRLAVDQHPPFAAGAVVAPQIVALAIALAVAQQGEEPPVGRQLRLPRARPVETGAGENALERQLGSGGHRAVLRDCGSGKAKRGGGKQH